MADTVSTVAHIRLGPAHRPTGETRHYFGDKLLPPPTALRIDRYDGPEGICYYLLYLDEQGREQTDTYHDTLEASMSQAHHEFSVRADDWIMAESLRE